MTAHRLARALVYLAPLAAVSTWAGWLYFVLVAAREELEATTAARDSLRATVSTLRRDLACTAEDRDALGRCIVSAGRVAGMGPTSHTTADLQATVRALAVEVTRLREAATRRLDCGLPASSRDVGSQCATNPDECAACDRARLIRALGREADRTMRAEGNLGALLDKVDRWWKAAVFTDEDGVPRNAQALHDEAKRIREAALPQGDAHTAAPVVPGRP